MEIRSACGGNEESAVGADIRRSGPSLSPRDIPLSRLSARPFIRRRRLSAVFFLRTLATVTPSSTSFSLAVGFVRCLEFPAVKRHLRGNLSQVASPRSSVSFSLPLSLSRARVIYCVIRTWRVRIQLRRRSARERHAFHVKVERTNSLNGYDSRAG